MAMSQKKNRQVRKQQHKPVIPKQPNSELIHKAEFFSGPLPTPDDLAKYKEIDPLLVETITTMAVDQQKHRHKLEARDQKITPFLYVVGQMLGWLLGVIAILGGVFLLYNDKSTEGYSMLIGSVVSLVGVYIYNKKRDEKLLGIKK